MKKPGFTLQEILLTLAIIGVVAALTIPVLTQRYNQRVWATSLSTAVSNFETAMSTMITKDGANDLFGTRAWRALNGGILTDEDGPIEEFMNAVSETFPLAQFYFNSELLADDEDSGYYDGIGSVLNNTREKIYDIPVMSESAIYQAKNGMFFYISIDNSVSDPEKISEIDAMDAGVTLTETAAKVAIDVNGEKAPNVIGRDIFFFILGADGVLYPYGSLDVNNKLGEEYTCRNRRGMGCTAQLIENNYVMNY